jgi:D-lactate dehydrogenase (cytochrome)
MSAVRGHLLSRGFPAYPRALFRQIKTPQAQVSSFRATRYNSSNSSRITPKSQRNFAGPNSPAQAAPGFWTSGKVLLASVLAASIGYVYAATSRPSQLESSEKPQYGTAKDFEKVRNSQSIARWSQAYDADSGLNDA